MSTIGPIHTGLVFRVLQGSHLEPVYHLSRAVVSIGRTTPETPCTPSYITFPEPTVSRLHLVLTWEPGAKAFMAHHRSQTNPTVLNGKALTRSELLKPGDILALGRLVVRLDQATESEARAEHPEIKLEQLQLCVRSTDQEPRTYLIPVKTERVSLKFTQERKTTTFNEAEGSTEHPTASVPAQHESTLTFQLQSSSETIEVESHSDQPPTTRRTLLPFGTLEVPLSPNLPVQFSSRDLIQHQGYLVWLSRQENPEPPHSTLEGSPFPEAPGTGSPKPIDSPSLQFLSGAWKGASVRIPDRGTHSFTLSTDTLSFQQHFPYPEVPSCRITVTDGVAQVRAGEIRDEQFLDVDGDLLFAGESTELFSGSRLLLGSLELGWEIPLLSREYLAFQVTHEGVSYPILRQEMKIGTAAHCDIRLTHPQLAPVVGTLKFTPRGFSYHHQNIAMSSRVDGTEVSAGLEQPVLCGAYLELAPGVQVRLEESP